MFRLHDKTRRRICIAGFFALCVVPTVLVACWCVGRHLPGHVRAEALNLSRELGLDVSLENLRHLRPGVVLYEGLELADAETGQTVLRCRRLEAQHAKTTDSQGRSTPWLVLIASQPEIQADALDRLGQVLQRVLRRRTGREDVHVRLTAGQLTLEADKNSQTLTELQGSIETLSGGTRARAGFRLAGVDMLQPVRIGIARNRQTTPPSTGFELDTGGGAVPCSVLALGLAEFASLGPRSRFRGYVWANETPEGWDAELTGELLEVDLGDLVTGRLPHKLSGTAAVTIRSARFRQGRLEEASGTLSAGPGVIGRRLLDSAVEQLGLVRGAEPDHRSDVRDATAMGRPGELVPYEQLALALAIDSAGLQIYGRCTSGGPGTILADRYNRLLGEPVLQPQPVAAVLRTLVPKSQVQVPATRETDWLMRHLPLPQVVPPRGAEPPLPHARLRLGRGAER